MFKIIALLSLFTSTLVAGDNLVFPWLTHNDSFQSDLVLNNLNGTNVSLNLTAVRPNGESAALDLELEPLQQWRMSAAEAFVELGKGSGFSVLVSGDTDGVTGAFVVFGTASEGSRSPAQANVANQSQSTLALLFNYLPSSEDVISAPVLVNTGDQDADIQLRAFQNGRKFGEQHITLPAGRPFAQVVGELFPGLTGDTYVTALSDQPLLGTAFIFNSKLEPSMANAVAIDPANIPNPVDIPPNPDAGLVTSFELGSFPRIEHLVADGAGNFYAAEGFDRDRVLKISPEGQVSTLAAGLGGPNAVAIDPAGNIFVSEFNTNTVSKITPSGEVSLVAEVDRGPNGITIDGDGNLFVTHFGSGSGTGFTIVKISPDGSTSRFSTDVQVPTGVTVDPDGNVYSASFPGGYIQKISPDGTSVRYASLEGVGGNLVYHNGNLYMTGFEENKIYKIDAEGNTTLYAGTGRSGTENGPRLEATFRTPWGIALYDNKLYVTSFGAAQGSIRVIHLD